MMMMMKDYPTAMVTVNEVEQSSTGGERSHVRVSHSNCRCRNSVVSHLLSWFLVFLLCARRSSEQAANCELRTAVAVKLCRGQ